MTFINNFRNFTIRSFINELRFLSSCRPLCLPFFCPLSIFYFSFYHLGDIVINYISEVSFPSLILWPIFCSRLIYNIYLRVKSKFSYLPNFHFFTFLYIVQLSLVNFRSHHYDSVLTEIVFLLVLSICPRKYYLLFSQSVFHTP